jgi:hypothetical protein
MMKTVHTATLGSEAIHAAKKTKLAKRSNKAL